MQHASRAAGKCHSHAGPNQCQLGIDVHLAHGIDDHRDGEIVLIGNLVIQKGVLPASRKPGSTVTGSCWRGPSYGEAKLSWALRTSSRISRAPIWVPQNIGRSTALSQASHQSGTAEPLATRAAAPQRLPRRQTHELSNPVATIRTYRIPADRYWRHRIGSGLFVKL